MSVSPVARVLASCLLLLGALSAPFFAYAQTTYDAGTLLPKVSLSFSPPSASFTEGSSFDVPIIVNTNGASINTLDISISFDPSKLSITKPTGGTSIIGLWLEPPAFDNTRGTATYVGAIPGGITTSSGVIGTITFTAKARGTATVSVRSDSSVLLNDGFGSQASVEYGSARYTIVPKAPLGVQIYSDTHPSEISWYNNNSPSFGWEELPQADGYAVVLDTKPTTVPETVITHNTPGASYADLADGLWYLHVRGQQNGVWGGTSHYLVRIDTTPPAEFRPRANYVLAAPVVVARALVSFFTTDNLSGIARYEVGVIDKASPVTQSPVFIQTESPYQLPQIGEAGAHVIVRAVDQAGNIRDEGIDVSASPSFFSGFLENYSLSILAGLLLIIILGFILHYLYGHHIIEHAKKALLIMKEEEEKEHHPEATPTSSTPPPVDTPK